MMRSALGQGRWWRLWRGIVGGGRKRRTGGDGEALWGEVGREGREVMERLCWIDLCALSRSCHV